MGSKNSKPDEPVIEQNFQRGTSRRSSKKERAGTISLNLKEIREQIAQFEGMREDDRYKNFQLILTRSSQEVQDLKRKSKAETMDVCENVQADIMDLLRYLEEVVSNNEMSLDSAAVESHSFIDQTPNARKKDMDYNGTKNPGRITNLDQIEDSTIKLMQDINNAIELQDHRQFVVFEKKIKLLYTDLEMIDVEEHTPLHERKESISRKLIRYNNKMRKAKSRTISQVDLLRPMNEDESDRKVQKELQTIMRVEMELEDLEIRALTFDDVKTDPKYKELDRALKDHWATLQNLRDSTENNRRRKLRTIDLIKKILQELNNRSEENASKIKSALEKINLVDGEVQVVGLEVDNFQGGKNEADYKNLDQKLRSMWAKLNDVHVSSENVVAKKDETIANIQKILKALLEKAEAFDTSTIYVNKEMLRNHAPSNTSQQISGPKNPKAAPRETMSEENYNLIVQTKELQNHWNNVNKVITENLTSSDKNDIVNILDSLSTEINRKIQELQRLSSQSFRYEAVLRKKKTKKNSNQVNENPIISDITKSNIQEKERTFDFEPQNVPVDELANSLKLSPSQIEIKTLPTAEIFGQIQKIQHEVNDIIKSIEIQGTKENNHEYHSKLINHIIALQAIDSNSSALLRSARTKALNLTQKAMDMLDQKDKKDDETNPEISEKNVEQERYQTHPNDKKQTEETIRLKGIIENLQKLKKKVDCFYGTYKNIQYVQIEKELNVCLKMLDLLDAKGNERIDMSKTQIKQKIIQYLNILDEKSLKVASQDEVDANKDSPYKQIDQLRTRLTDLKSAMENFDGKYKDDAYLKLVEEVENCRVDLKAIHEINNSIKSSKKQYYDYIEQLLLYFQEKLSPDSELGNEHTLLTKFENEIIALKREIAAIGSTISDAQFYYLDDNLLQVQLKILDIKVTDADQEAQRKNLVEDIQTLMNFIQSKRDATKRMSRMSSHGVWLRIQEIRDEILVLGEKIEDFRGPDIDKQYDRLDENMSAIFLKIKCIEDNGNQQIKQACDDLIKEVQNNKQSLNKKLKVLRDSNDPVTQV